MCFFSMVVSKVNFSFFILVTILLHWTALNGQTPTDDRKFADQLFNDAVNTLQRPQSLEQVQQARTALLNSLEIYRRLKEADSEIRALRLLGAAFSMEGNADKAAETWEEALRLAREKKNKSEEAANLTNLASYYSDKGEAFTSQQLSEQALKIIRELVVAKKPRALDMLGIVLGNLGAGFAETGEFQKAIDYSIEARAIAQELQDKGGEATVLVNLGLAYINKGLYNDAAATLNIAHKLAQDPESRNPDTEARVLNNLGLLQFFLGRYDEAISYWTQSVKVSEPLSNPALSNKAKGSIGVALRARGRVQDARAALEEALDLARRGNDVRAVIYWLGNLAGVYADLGSYEKSIEYYRQAITMARDAKDFQGQGRFTHGLGVTYLKQKKLKDAHASFDEALAIAKTSQDPTLEWNAYHGLALVSRDLRQLTKSRFAFERAMSVLEKLRGSVERDVYKTSLLEDKQSFFYDFVDLLLRQKNYFRAYEICEAARGRAFIDLLASRTSEASDPIRTRLKPLEALEERKAALTASLSTTKESKTRVAIEIERAVNTKGVERFIASLDPDLKSLVTVPPVRVGAAKEIARRRKATILSYFVMPEKLLIWIISPNGKLLAPKQVHIDSEELKAAIELGREYASSASSDPQILRVKLNKLRETLIDPIQERLPANADNLIIVVPHRELMTLPFAPFIDKDGHYLVEKHTFVYMPSIHLYKFLRTPSRATNGRQCSAVLVGNPEYPAELKLAALPESEEEVKEISKIISQMGCRVAPPLIGLLASETKVRSAIRSKASIIHFATHGLFIEKDPFRSAVVLASDESEKEKGAAADGFITVGESFGLNLSSTQLLVLSSCDSGLGELTADGVLGFSRGFMYAGAQSILVSFWKVNDTATKEQMVRFYREYKSNLDKAKALRQAQLHMIRELRAGRIKSSVTLQTLDEHPAHWAAFLLFGNTR